MVFFHNFLLQWCLYASRNSGTSKLQAVLRYLGGNSAEPGCRANESKNPCGEPVHAVFWSGHHSAWEQAAD
jgi:hypothetical protein